MFKKLFTYSGLSLPERFSLHPSSISIVLVRFLVSLRDYRDGSKSQYKHWRQERPTAAAIVFGGATVGCRQNNGW
jgi:hypothetical protein